MTPPEVELDPAPHPVWVDGELLPAERASVSALDHGFLLGDGAFETLRADDGEPWHWARHLRRLRATLRRLDLDLELPWTDDDLGAAATAVLDGRPGLRRLRLTASSGVGPLGPARGDGRPTVVLAAGPLPPAPASVRVVTTPWARNERSPLAGVKSTSYAEGVALLAHARRAGADEVLLADTLGRTSEAAAANVVVGTAGIALTPGLAAGCLPGIAREVLLEAGAVAEADLPLAAALAADELCLVSSLRGVVPVSHVDDRPLPTVGGPIAERLTAALEHAAPDDRP